MGKLLDKLDSGATTVWLDHLGYAAALLSRGVVPWSNTAEFISLLGRAQGLLKSDVVAFPLAPACAAWIEANPGLAAAMGSKSRVGFPLKTLLSDEALRAHLLEVANGLRASMAGAILALVLPSPRAWLGIAYGQGHGGATVDVEDDDADSASVYVADFLRGFANSVDVLSMQEAADFTPRSADQIALYQAVVNVGRNYRWDIGLHVQGNIDAAVAEAIDFTIAPGGAAGKRQGVVVPAEYWSGQGSAPASKFRYATIPADAKPETVLDRLAALR